MGDRKVHIIAVRGIVSHVKRGRVEPQESPLVDAVPISTSNYTKWKQSGNSISL